MSEALARQILLASASGLLYPLCFPDFDFGPLAWIVLLPLHVAIDGAHPRRAFWVGWLAGLIAFIGTMFWVVTAMHLYGKMPLLASYAVMLLLTTYLGLYVALYALAIAWLRKNLSPFAFLAAPFIWVTLELLRTHLLSGLPWALLGYSQYQWLLIIQIADLTGVYGVSFLIVLVNAAIAEVALWIVHRFKQPLGPFPWLSPTAAALMVALTLFYGHAQLNHSQDTASASPRDSHRSIFIGLIQPNIDQAQKWDAAFRRATLDRYAKLTAQAAQGSALILWPEAATPFLFEQELLYRLEVMELVRTHNVPLLFGSPALRHFPNGRPYLLNSAYLLLPDGMILGRYDKRHLVPFGEYIPLKPVLFFLDKLVEGIGDFEAGTVYTVLELPIGAGADRNVVKFGVVICYEVIFPNLVREFVANGAQFMVTITNDAWFGKSAAAFQHFGMVVLRAVENRVAFARSANTGISGFIDPQGRILHATPIFTEEVVTGRIPVGRVRTFYTQQGDVFAYGCVIITGLFVLAARLRTNVGTGGQGQRRRRH
ncbi:MAG TPA: apolipoprotein N-acyltransferase [Nitrospiraceae bacterium]|nr:apolipoprotein N-acyltransferase [Nitrospiraceae bacterium]